jgi:hypothetical protein
VVLVLVLLLRRRLLRLVPLLRIQRLSLQSSQ